MSKEKSLSSVSKAKIFVLDTNVLLHDPQCLHKFEDNTIAIPVEVLEELDGKKSAPGELGFSARKIHRDLRALFDEGLETPPELNGQGSSALSRKLPNGGRLVVVINDYMVAGESESEVLNRLKATLVNLEKMDSRILASVFFLKEVCPDSRVILVTKDANMALKGIALGLEVQDYMNDKVTTAKLGGGCKTIKVENADYERFLEEQGVDLSPELTSHLYLNEYIYISNGEFSEPARYRGDGQVDALILGTDVGVKIPKGIRIYPLNSEQRMLMDALLDEDIKLVTCSGKAGTGKTLVSIAMALFQTIGEDNLYERVFISRPLVNIGKDTGALPGTLEEKMAPYIAPFFDNLEVLFSNRKVVKQEEPTNEDAHINRITSTRKRKKAMAKLAKQPSKQESAEEENKPRKPFQFLFDYGMVEVEAMTFIRGRSLSNTIFIIDEAQNLTPHEAKTVVSRMAEGSKVILLGDPYQVDSMFLDAWSNGLVHTAQRLKGTEITAHLELSTGVRSELADLAADLL
ncbi:PhoH family protein [Coraliomargarita sp. SDUM461003]|uniref:PhoH family protein n=1 Tax=Thalassobacterium maritimum TaxID=3041265 RepID=A0ABU1ASJ0_9BACT|nr:PhoH family protein [Coraliomargarita sp. SDUM461003]MDQ8207018.1 PhoH family protein [Coraliomargarita sp. SDUM461003]